MERFHAGNRSFFERASLAITSFAREHRARRARHIALTHLMEMDSARLDDLGLTVEDIADALARQPTPLPLEDRRSARASAWRPLRPASGH